MKKILSISMLVAVSCVIMGIVDAVIQPGYAVKSLIKIILFLIIPFLYSVISKDYTIIKCLKPEKKGFLTAVFSGIIIYAVILGAYFIFRNIFDFSSLTKSLNETTGVNKSNFLWVALYISFVNSFLEEFFFRGFGFLTLKRVSSVKFAYIFSSLTFALYHIAMMIGWFGVPVILIALIGLFAGGLIFNRFDEKKGTVYLSWLVHMFANFSINSIGFILFGS